MRSALKSFGICRLGGAALAVALGWGSTAAGGEPFSLSAQSTSGAAAQAAASGHSLPDLVQDLIETNSSFSSLEGKDFTASLTYGGVKNAVQLERNAAGTSATLTIPSTGFSRTFTGANDREVRNAIRDFLLEDGSKDFAKFLRTINEQSRIGVTDGNPLATTALLADGLFTRFGLQRTPMEPEIVDPLKENGTRLDFEGGFANTNDGDGYYASATISTLFRFNERVGLSFAFPFLYRDVEGAQVFHLGSEVALPIILIGDEASVVRWQVTPAFLGGASGSVDLAAGGTFLGGGVVSSLRFRLGRSTTLSIANEVAFFEGFPINIGKYDFDTDLSQQILKNGVKLTQALGPRAFIDAGLTYTNFLQNAAVDHYWTPAAGLGLMFNDTSGLRVAYQADLGDGYTAHGGTLELFFNY